MFFGPVWDTVVQVCQPHGEDRNDERHLDGRECQQLTRPLQPPSLGCRTFVRPFKFLEQELGQSARDRVDGTRHPRSEEQTYELQSLMRISYAVFCLEKKNDTKINQAITVLV